MFKYAAVPLLAILAACSAEVENGEAAEANVVDTLSVENLVITNSNTATAVSEMEMQAPPPAQPAQTAAPVADKRDGRTTAAEPKQQTVRKPSAEAAPKPAPKATPEPNAAAPKAEPKAEPEAPTTTCTAEHRALGHC